MNCEKASVLWGRWWSQQLDIELADWWKRESGSRWRVISRVCGTPGHSTGPAPLLLYVSDIGKDITSNIRLFSDDCILYRCINDKLADEF